MIRDGTNVFHGGKRDAGDSSSKRGWGGEEAEKLHTTKPFSTGGAIKTTLGRI